MEVQVSQWQYKINCTSESETGGPIAISSKSSSDESVRHNIKTVM
jgi:hypothetical protein